MVVYLWNIQILRISYIFRINRNVSRCLCVGVKHLDVKLSAVYEQSSVSVRKHQSDGPRCRHGDGACEAVTQSKRRPLLCVCLCQCVWVCVCGSQYCVSKVAPFSTPMLSLLSASGTLVASLQEEEEDEEMKEGTIKERKKKRDEWTERSDG